jgi:hypothetical protein
MDRYTGHCRFSGESNAPAMTIQILLRTKCFTDSLTQTSGAVFKLFRKLYKEMTNQMPWLDIDPLIKVDRSVLGGSCELTDCFSGLFRLFGTPIPRMTSPTGVIFHLSHDNSLARYFDELVPDPVNDLDVIFFGTRSAVLSDIPEILGQFSLYVVVTRLSKTNSHLCFRDSQGWLSIRGRDIEEVTSFRRDNISLLGYIRDLNSTNLFRSLLNSQNTKRRRHRRSEKRPDPTRDRSEPIHAPRMGRILGREPHILTASKKSMTIVFWADPEDSPWGSETRMTVEIAPGATGDELLTTMGRLFESPLNLTNGYDIFKVSDDLE